MSNYTITTDFGAKDSLPSSNSAKVVRGSEFTTEFTNIQTAIATKADIAGSSNISVDRGSSSVNLTLTGANPEIILNDSTNTNTCSIQNVDGSIHYRADEDNEFGNSRHRFYTDGTQRMEIEANGNVGIGTDSPSSYNSAGDNLVIADTTGSAGITLASSTAGAGHILFADSTTGTGAYDGFIKYSHEDVQMTFAVNAGVARMVIDSSGNVGIGTTSPNESLVVKGGTYAANQSGGMALQMGDTSGSHWQSSFKIKSDGSGNVRTTLDASTGAIGGQSQEVISINTAGNVGIGTTSPSAKLEVSATAPTYTNLGTVLWGGTTNNDNHTGISLSSSGDALGGSVGSNLYYSNSSTATQSNTNRSSGEIKIDNTTSTGTSTIRLGGYAKGTTTFDEHMRIDSSGNLLVGTTTTDIAEATTATGIVLNNGGWYEGSRDGGTVGYFNRLSSDGEILSFRKDGTNVGAIGTNSGNIYLTDGARSLIVDGGVIKAGYSTGGDADNVQDLGSSSVRFKDLYLSGTVITDGVTTSAYAWSSQSNSTSSSVHLYFRNPNGFVGNISTSGTSTSYNTSSDERLKENIADSADAGSKVDAIQIRQFDWKADGSHQDYGVIAQELVTVAPEAVHQPEDSEEMMGVDYSKLVPMLIKEVQSLRSRVAELENA